MTAGSGEAGVRAEKTLDAALPMPDKKNMQRVFDFLRENSLQYCATVGLDKKPKVRPFQMIYHRGGKLVYCTGSHKDVYAELLAFPYLEISVSMAERWLRIRGKAVWIESRRARERVIEESPLVKSIYKDADNPLLKVFYIGEAEAVLADFSGLPPQKIKLS